mmetsp:Transcript_12224/g.18295  ORF Transcript_12224/g.18295 Transcript_12224/m.18295 type:complete len:546 (-) Transcript_12224:19-1656(-)
MLSAFDTNERKGIAIIDENQRLEIYNVEEGKLIQNYNLSVSKTERISKQNDEIENQSIKVTAVSWFRPSSTKKRKIDERLKEKSENLGLFAVGKSDGSIDVFDLTRGVTKANFYSNKAIRALDFSIDGKVLYSANSSEKLVEEWDVSQAKRLREINCKGAIGISNIRVHPGGKSLAVASRSSVQIINLSNEKRLRNYKFDESSENRTVKFSSDGRFVLTLDNTNKLLQLKSCLEDERSAKSLLVFNFKKVYESSDLCVNQKTENDVPVVSILMLGNNGKAVILRKKLGQNEKLETCKIYCSDEGKNIINGRLNESAEQCGSVILVGDSKPSKTFKSIGFIGDDGKMKESSSFSFEAETELLKNVKVEAVEDEKELMMDIQSDSEQMVIKSDEQLVRGDVEVPASDSRVTVVEQALKSMDIRRLKVCMFESDADTVKATVEGLSKESVIPLFSVLVEFMERCKLFHAIQKLQIWIKFILVKHSDYLLTVADLSDKVKCLYQKLNTSTKSLKKFQKLEWKMRGIIEGGEPTLKAGKVNSNPAAIVNG